MREIGEVLRNHKEGLDTLVSYEMGKSLQEGFGEVREMIDIADFAVGLSRQLYGLTMHSERAEHRRYEQYHPLGIVGIISAFNVEGGKLNGDDYSLGFYVKPCIAEVENHFKIVQHETFAPILYLIKYKTVQEAIALQNSVLQGMSSAIMNNNLREAEQFLSYAGSDCGLANVNIGTSGAALGGAFGGEKEIGCGRESGSDTWKVYMRR